MIDIYIPVVECGHALFFADVLSIYSCILLFFSLKEEMPIQWEETFTHGTVSWNEFEIRQCEGTGHARTRV
jgi:hypothetical protein